MAEAALWTVGGGVIILALAFAMAAWLNGPDRRSASRRGDSGDSGFSASGGSSSRNKPEGHDGDSSDGGGDGGGGD